MPGMVKQPNHGYHAEDNDHGHCYAQPKENTMITAIRTSPALRTYYDG